VLASSSLVVPAILFIKHLQNRLHIRASTKRDQEGISSFRPMTTFNAISVAISGWATPNPFGLVGRLASLLSEVPTIGSTKRLDPVFGVLEPHFPGTWAPPLASRNADVTAHLIALTQTSSRRDCEFSFGC
jgi:hypothetical protein